MPRTPVRAASSVSAAVRSSFHAVPYRKSGMEACWFGIASLCHERARSHDCEYNVSVNQAQTVGGRYETPALHSYSRIGFTVCAGKESRDFGRERSPAARAQ